MKGFLRKSWDLHTYRTCLLAKGSSLCHYEYGFHLYLQTAPANLLNIWKVRFDNLSCRFFLEPEFSALRINSLSWIDERSLRSIRSELHGVQINISRRDSALHSTAEKRQIFYHFSARAYLIFATTYLKDWKYHFIYDEWSRNRDIYSTHTHFMHAHTYIYTLNTHIHKTSTHPDTPLVPNEYKRGTIRVRMGAKGKHQVWCQTVKNKVQLSFC